MASNGVQFTGFQTLAGQQVRDDEQRLAPKMQIAGRATIIAGCAVLMVRLLEMSLTSSHFLQTVRFHVEELRQHWVAFFVKGHSLL